MKKPKKQTDFWDNAGKILIDLGKLVFGGIIIGGILRGTIPPAILIASGFVAAMIFFIIGLNWTTKEKPENKE
jgi:uncharacterized membrane protein YraQ (UPF0718 family)